LVDQQIAELKQEAEQDPPALRSGGAEGTSATEALMSKRLNELEPLRSTRACSLPKRRRTLAGRALENQLLRKQAKELLEKARTAAADERAQAPRKQRIARAGGSLAKPSDSDAGRIVSSREAGGADWRVTLTCVAGQADAVSRRTGTLEPHEGYGDRYVVPTRSLLDDLAADFGHTEEVSLSGRA